MKVKARIKKTGKEAILRPYGWGYVSSDGKFYHVSHITVLEVING
jgi:hypothetical protein